MFRFRVRKIPGPLLKFTQKAVLFQDISIFFVLKTELYLSSGTYFFFWKLVFHFTFLRMLSQKKAAAPFTGSFYSHEILLWEHYGQPVPFNALLLTVAVHS